MSGTSARDVEVDKKIAELAPAFLSPDQINEARNNIKDILDGKSQNITPEFQEKMREAAMAGFRVALPGVIEYLKYLVESSECPNKIWKEKCIKNISTLETSLGDKDGLVAGCSEFKFGDKKAIAYIRLCSKDHDLTGQLIKMTKLFGEKYQENEAIVKGELSALVWWTRSVWKRVIHTNQKMAKQIQNIIGNKYSENIRSGLLVDQSNTTLYIDPTLPRRLGIFIELV